MTQQDTPTKQTMQLGAAQGSLLDRVRVTIARRTEGRGVALLAMVVIVTALLEPVVFSSYQVTLGRVALIGLVAWFLSPLAALFGIVVPSFVSSAAGAYLFYAQHNFPGIELKDRREWTYHHAALKCSSMFDMSPVMHWFTGNIGYHHIHHLNHKIPFYRLPETMAAMPELQSPYRTTWRPSDMWACLRLKVWDAEQGRLITWAELEEARQPEAAAAK